MKRLGWIGVGLVTVLFVGCALGLGTWTKADMTGHVQDSYECRREATYPRTFGFGGTINTKMTVDTTLYRACMAARGYVRAD